MRISDWSSDVCSSDLDRLSIRAEGQRSATGLALAVDLDVETCPYLEWDWRVERLQEGANPYERALDDGAASILVMFGDTGDFAAPRQVQTRSEEHTSGLQSIMRMTYDAFCLKK